MDWTVKPFGPFAETVSRREVRVGLEEPTPTVADLRQRIVAVEPVLVPLLGVRVAENVLKSFGLVSVWKPPVYLAADSAGGPNPENRHANPGWDAG